jgi:hypothetical protein
MYTVYFLIGFMTSFGWWSAGKVQKAIDGTPPQPPAAIIEKIEK